MSDRDILNLFVSRWGLDATIYVAAWSIIGLGIGCLIGYSTKNIAIKEKENQQ